MTSTLLLLALSSSAMAQESSFDQGYAAGLEEAQQESLIKPAAAGFAGSFFASSVGCLSLGCAGIPVAAAGLAVPPAVAYVRPVDPPPAGWVEEPVDFQFGYIDGYADASRRRRTRAMIVATALGTGIGGAVGFTALLVVGGQLGYGPL